MDLQLPDNPTKESAIQAVQDYIDEHGFSIIDTDFDKPWGAYFSLGPDAEEEFIKIFFPTVSLEEIYMYGQNLRPKFLIVSPNEQLSWQYHDRRAELWTVIAGPVGVLVSNTDEKPLSPTILDKGSTVTHNAHIRHRLIGLDSWGLVAEIWQHTDANNPSEEADIVRLEDNYGRNE